MDFVKYILTPAGQSETDPLITRLTMTRGRLVGGCVYFPYGPAGYLHFLAKIGIHQILPFNTGENLRLDDAVFPFDLGIDLKEPPFVVDLITWNDSVEYAHALTVSFSLEPELEGNGEAKDIRPWGPEIPKP